MELDQLAGYTGLPLSQSHRLLDFETAVVDTLETFPPQQVLRVAGSAPYPGMGITLEPRIYIQQPDFWGIEVVGILLELQPPRRTPYAVELELSGSVGTQGIEVVGASRSQRITLTGGENPGRTTVRLRGVVRDPGDWPLRGVAVRADPVGDELPESLATVTDAEGRYSMALARPGRYRVSARADGYTATVTETDISEEIAGRVDFFLAPAATLRPTNEQADVETEEPVPELNGRGEQVGGSEQTEGEAPADVVEGADDAEAGQRKTGAAGTRGRRTPGRNSTGKS